MSSTSLSSQTRIVFIPLQPGCSSLLDIGKAEGDEAYLFTRVVHASALSRGELLVADRTTLDFRIFDSTGRFVRRFGRKGRGPAEFQNLSWVGVARSGFIAAYDFRLRRLSRFSSDGTLQQAFSLLSFPVGSVLGQFGDGSILLRSRIGLPGEDDLAKLSSGLVRDSLGLFLISPDGSSSTPVGQFPGTQEIRAVGNGRIAMDAAPFGLRTVIAVADTVFYVSTQESYEIRAYRKDGRLQRVFRRQVAPEPVSATAKARWQRQRDERLARVKSGRPLPPEVLAVEEYQTLPNVFPAHGELRIDRLGNLWVEDYRPFPSEDTLTTWIVFSPDGTILATAELPNTQITDIGADRIVGVSRDDDDVPHVRVYRLVKGSPRGAAQN